jgi:hypothetical protein
MADTHHARPPKSKNVHPPRGCVRYSCGDKIVCMAAIDGYVMCRRPHRVPMVVSLSEWYEWKAEAPHG